MSKADKINTIAKEDFVPPPCDYCDLGCEIAECTCFDFEQEDLREEEAREEEDAKT
jgi:hypothetical protein